MLFNWEDYHLHDFIVGRRVYSVPDPDDAFNERKVIDERHVPLNRIVNPVGDSFEYVYDFGDDWHHAVLLEAILLPSPDGSIRAVSRARGMDRRRMQAALAAIRITSKRSPTRTTRNTRTWWRGRGAFEPEAFSIDAINASLKRTFNRRAPGKKAAEPAAADRDIDELTKFMLAAL